MAPAQYPNLTLAGQIDNREKAQRLGRMGGSVRSKKRSWSLRLFQLKKKGLNDDTYKALVAMMEEPESWALDNLLYLNSIKPTCNNPNQKILLAQAINQLYKLHHGEKIKTENTNVNINLDWNDILKNAELSDDAKVRTKKTGEEPVQG